MKKETKDKLRNFIGNILFSRISAIIYVTFVFFGIPKIIKEIFDIDYFSLLPKGTPIAFAVIIIYIIRSKDFDWD